MWRAGFGLDFLCWMLNALALAFGAFLGARGLLDPRWAAHLVRLKPDDAQPGGFAEFRATFGGVFFGLHAVALLLSAYWIWYGVSVIGLYAAGAALALAAGWAGASGGRLLSIWRDGTKTPFNLMSAALEGFVALMIGAPWVAWWFERPPA